MKFQFIFTILPKQKTSNFNNLQKYLVNGRSVHHFFSSKSFNPHVKQFNQKKILNFHSGNFAKEALRFQSTVPSKKNKIIVNILIRNYSLIISIVLI